MQNTNYALMEFIYFLKENTNIIMKMKSLLSYNENLSYLSRIIHGSDILSLNKEDIKRWVEELRSHTDYHTVVFCIGCYTEAMIELMNLSDTVLVAATESPYEKAVLKEWEQQMKRIGIATSDEKYQYLRLSNDTIMEPVPVSFGDLARSSSWLYAQQYLNC